MIRLTSLRPVLLAGLLSVTSLAAADPVAEAVAAFKARDYAKAAQLIAAPAAAGDPAALFLKGQMAETGRGMEHSHTQAAGFYRQAMEKGHAGAMGAWGRYQLAALGGVPRDEAKGLFHIRKAAESGSAQAMVLMGDLALAGAGQEPDARTAAFWYQRAAAEKEATGLLGLARLYDTGAGGLIRDESRATALVLDAAKLGEPLAMNEMGLRYQAGRGVAQDNVAAVGWFALAAQHDLAAALVNLGTCYESGNGCLKDLDRAGASYAAAAKQGHPAGQFLLGSLFERGEGIKANPVFAYVNYVRAAAGGYKDAEARRDAVKATLDARQLAEAEKLLTPAASGK